MYALVFLSLLSDMDEDNIEVTHMLENCAASFTRQYFDTKAGRFRYQRHVGDDEKEQEGEPRITEPFRAVDP